MKKSAYWLFVLAVLWTGSPASADSRAVNISIGSIGGDLDDAALLRVRQVVGHAVARGIVDEFIVYSPRVGSPLPIEGGLSACAKAGFNTTHIRFNAFIQELLSVHPKQGTFYNVERTRSCDPDGNVFCTQDAKVCPDGSFVGRIPPACDFAPCPRK